MSDAFASITLAIREERATTMVGASKMTAGGVRAACTGQGRADGAAIAGDRRPVLSIVESLSAIRAPAVVTPSTAFATLFDSEDARFITLDMAEL
jgi:tellurite resistance protein